MGLGKYRHPERKKEYLRQWKKAHPQQVKMYAARWAKAHPEYLKEYRQKNAERIKQLHKKYCEERKKSNPDYYKVYRIKQFQRRRIDRSIKYAMKHFFKTEKQTKLKRIVLTDEERRERNYAAVRKYRAEHKKEQNERMRRYRKTAAWRQYIKRYHIQYHQKILQSKRKWHERHKDSWNASRRAKRQVLREQLFNLLIQRCTGCGSIDKHALRFVNIDREENDRELKKSDYFYRYYLERPEEARQKLQVLCTKCNFKDRCENHGLSLSAVSKKRWQDPEYRKRTLAGSIQWRVRRKEQLLSKKCYACGGGPYIRKDGIMSWVRNYDTENNVLCRRCWGRLEHQKLSKEVISKRRKEFVSRHPDVYKLRVKQMLEAQSKKWQDPVWRTQRVEELKKHVAVIRQSAEWKRKQSESRKKLWQDPDFQRRYSEAVNTAFLISGKRKEFVCWTCKKKFIRSRSKIVHQPNGRVYCSKHCRIVGMRGSNNLMYDKKRDYYAAFGFRSDLGHIVRSTWEANYCRILKHLDISYEYEPETFSLSYQRSYTPDIKLRDNLYVEIKGYPSPTYKYKVRSFRKRYPYIRLIIITEKHYRGLTRRFAKQIANWEKIDKRHYT